ncbi:hypothetical protein PPROV_000879200 [Pycnococcus provasolii]|uniref:tRNA carboxymethyluridine synthase n=2 Tax=Pycnococcus provasolii TaxID=41880 RepID=A0A830HYZ4_9CHLO|nr:hypothetical protein PPROV_000879200 [Pycnococcus provasolii]
MSAPPPPPPAVHHARPRFTRDPALFAVTNGQCAEQCDEIYHYTDLEDIFRHWDTLIPEDQLAFFQEMVTFLHNLKKQYTCEADLTSAMIVMRKKFKSIPKKSQLLYAYNTLVASTPNFQQRSDLLAHLTKKASKSNSGVLVITVLTSPTPTLSDGTKQRFSCAWNCYYCPNEPGQPRSYLHDEPAVMRANANGFDPVMQFHDRAGTLAYNGHPVDKIEILILGGTWCSYPRQYQEEFVRDLFFSANTFYERQKRPRHSLAEEIALNEKAACKIIGVTLETRPDTIDAEEIRRFRMLGCTRVQLGIQHTDDAVLTRVNRGHTTDHSRTAIRRLKDAGFKVDVHLMPCLPGADPSADMAMFDDVLYDHTLSADQWKIYPCEITPWTVIEKWYKEGTYKPYGADQLMHVLRYVLRRVHPWIRLNRVIRDIPTQYILGGCVTSPNMRQDVDAVMRKAGEFCNDIRSREVLDDAEASSTSELVERRHVASHRVEYFLSFETPSRDKIAGFLRLRLPDTEPPERGDENGDDVASKFPDEGNVQPFPELKGCALIRELHVYGPLVTALFPGEENGAVAAKSSSAMALARATSAAIAAGATSVWSDGRSFRSAWIDRSRQNKPPADAAAAAAVAAAAVAAAPEAAMPPVAAAAAPEAAMPPVAAAAAAAAGTSQAPLTKSQRRKERRLQGQASPSPSPPPRRSRVAGEAKPREAAQHRGIGRRLMDRAEKLAKMHGYRKIAVISGVGARHYYRRLGYHDDGGEGQYLVKYLDDTRSTWRSWFFQLLQIALGFVLALVAFRLRDLFVVPSVP